MATARLSPKLAVAVGLAVVTLGGTGWVVASASTDPSSSDTSDSTPYPSGLLVPPGKGPLPSARVTPPATSPLPNPADSGLKNSVQVCGGAPYCRLQGISPDHQAPFSQQDFQVSNEYFGTYNGTQVTVYAGAKLAPRQGNSVYQAIVGGGVRVALGNNPLQEYLAPPGTGPLTILSVNGTTLTLQEQGGTTVTFSLESHTYS